MNSNQIFELAKKTALSQGVSMVLYNDNVSMQSALEDAGAILGASYLDDMVYPFINSLKTLSPEQSQMVSNLVSTVGASYAIEKFITGSKEPLMEKVVRFGVSSYGSSLF